MNADVEFHIRHNYPWSQLPANVRQGLGNSQREYEKAVVNFSVKNQLRYKGNLVRHVRKDEKKYYEELLKYSREHLMLYPYHLSDVMVKGLRITPFAYYTGIMTDIMHQEKSYDALPNFTAADCLRLLGIGRNQYIELMNQCRSSKKIFRKKPVRELLPTQPVDNVVIEPWWIAQAGYITEDDVRMCMLIEKEVIDKIIDSGPQTAGTLDYQVLCCLYKKGLIYLDVNIADDDCIIVPPLEGFVMNRVLGDYFETLLYKIFVSIDEHTTVAELANVLQVDVQLVKNAVSMYCRLGFAKRKGKDFNQEELHSSWTNVQQNYSPKKPTQDQLLIDWSQTITKEEKPIQTENNQSPDNISLDGTTEHSKRIAFLFDSTLTAFLMMGNLSQGLKNHAVTMFEVGKLSDELLNSFLDELKKIDNVGEGEAQRYFDHAITLRKTIEFLRYNKDLSVDPEFNYTGQGIDLLRCESLLGLEPATCARVLNKNYSLLVSMAPLSNEIRPISSCTPQHLGPAIPEMNSVWFKLFIYHMTGSGPPSLLLVKGTRLRKLPRVFQEYDKLWVTTWGHDPSIIPTSNVLLPLNDALSHSAVLVQGYGWHQKDGETYFVPFPLDKTDTSEHSSSLENHSAIQRLASVLDLKHSCGFATLLKTGKTYNYSFKTPPHIVSPSSLDSRSDSASSSTDNPFSSPKNGIKDSVSAEILASEIDSLALLEDRAKAQRKSMSPAKEKLTLDVASAMETSTTSGDQTVDSDWVLLDCCYGVPLFNAHLNLQVCERIASQGLCSRESLQEELHSSRKLSLQLLNFIAEHQDLPILQEQSHESGMLPQSKNTGEQMVPLPTHNILFSEGRLATWDGQ